MKALTWVFDPFSSECTYIQYIRFNYDCKINQKTINLEIVDTLKLLNTLSTKEVSINDWRLSEESFKLLTEIKDIEQI